MNKFSKSRQLNTLWRQTLDRRHAAPEPAFIHAVKNRSRECAKIVCFVHVLFARKYVFVVRIIISQPRISTTFMHSALLPLIVSE
ncbi:hypothetical protein VTL71DRAFT_1211 [Oculimacula yallundae]|uniref:Uncharacterized protein n=1 Tax=Oculimacula yallundae TaxID=86028 RepID=A0ABR4CA22_9HELO